MTDNSKPAFPGSVAVGSSWDVYTSDKMTLREYYAGLAMQGLLTSGQGSDMTAILAVEFADALIKALEASND